MKGDTMKFQRGMKKQRMIKKFRSKKGIEMVQAAILIALAVAIGVIFRTEITDFVNRTFEGLNG